jgi:hypothetical protein
MGRSVDSLERRWCHCPRRSPHSIFFGAFHALAIDDGGGGTGLSFDSLPTFRIKRVVDAIQRAVVAPQVEIIKKRAARWQVLRDCTPLASRAQNIHDPVHHFAHVNVALVAAALGWRDQRFDMRPFIVRQITRISQFAAIVPPAIFRRPHPRPPNQASTLESQTIHLTQDDFGQTLRLWKIGGAVLRQPNQIEFEWQQTWQANDEVMYCPERHSRAYVLPMAIFVDRTRICARELGWFPVLHMDRVTTQTSLLQGVKPADVIRP